MNALKLLTLLGLVLALTVPAAAAPVVVPLPPPGTMSMDAFGGFAEIFLEVTNATNPLGLPVGVYNDIAIGVYLRNAGSPGPAGTAGFVLYTGSTTSVAGPASLGTTELAFQGGAGEGGGLPSVMINEIFEGETAGGDPTNTRGRLYVGGIVNTINTTNTVTYNHGDGDTETNPQLTFAVYNAFVQSLTLNAGAGNQLVTEFVITPPAGEGIHLDVWADDVSTSGGMGDATIGTTTGAGQRYASASTSSMLVRPELPVRDDNLAGNAGTLLVDLNDGTYWDRSGPADWGELAFAGDPSDDDNVFWSFVGNPDSFFRVTELFDLTGPGVSEGFLSAFDLDGNGMLDDFVYTAGGSTIVDPRGLQFAGQFIPGVSLASGMNVNGLSWTRDDGMGFDGQGWGNHLLDPNANYALTGLYSFGGAGTGAFDSDPRTFTFQQGEPGAVAAPTQLIGPLQGVIPEPVTMLGLLLGAGSIVGYIRKRRA